MPEIIKHGNRYIAKKVVCTTCGCEFLVRPSEGTWIGRFGYEYADKDPVDLYMITCPECDAVLKVGYYDSEVKK